MKPSIAALAAPAILTAFTAHAEEDIPSTFIVPATDMTAADDCVTEQLDATISEAAVMAKKTARMLMLDMGMSEDMFNQAWDSGLIGTEINVAISESDRDFMVAECEEKHGVSAGLASVFISYANDEGFVDVFPDATFAPEGFGIPEEFYTPEIQELEL